MNGDKSDSSDPLDIFTNIDRQPKRLAIEKIYQKKSQLEHILLRPDTYIGSVERTDKAVCFLMKQDEIYLLGSLVKSKTYWL